MRNKHRKKQMQKREKNTLQREFSSFCKPANAFKWPRHLTDFHEKETAVEAAQSQRNCSVDLFVCAIDLQRFAELYLGIHCFIGVCFIKTRYCGIMLRIKNTEQNINIPKARTWRTHTMHCASLGVILTVNGHRTQRNGAQISSKLFFSFQLCPTKKVILQFGEIFF